MPSWLSPSISTGMAFEAPSPPHGMSPIKVPVLSVRADANVLTHPQHLRCRYRCY